MTSYHGMAMADFRAMIEARTTTELLDMIEGRIGTLTIMQIRAIRAEIKSREI